MVSQSTGRGAEDGISIRLPGTQEAAAQARRGLSRLRGDLDPPLMETLRLLVTELVTNGVRHGSRRGPVEVSVTLAEGSVRVEVSDCGRGFSPADAPMPRSDGSGGWGLQLVDRVATTWGVRVDGGTCVWFELAA